MTTHHPLLLHTTTDQPSANGTQYPSLGFRFHCFRRCVGAALIAVDTQAVPLPIALATPARCHASPPHILRCLTAEAAVTARHQYASARVAGVAFAAAFAAATAVAAVAAVAAAAVAAAAVALPLLK